MIALCESHFAQSASACRSLVAVAAYAALLPATLLLGQAAFMTYVVKLCDHLGRLLALLGIKPIRQPYVTE